MKELSEKLATSSSEIIKKLMKMGIMATFGTEGKTYPG